MAKDKYNLTIPTEFKKADKDKLDLKFNTKGQLFFGIKQSYLDMGYTEAEAAKLSLYYQQFGYKEKEAKKPKKIKGTS